LVALGVVITSVAAGTEELLYSWGKGEHGRLGSGKVEKIKPPTLVSGELEGHSPSTMIAGEFHSMAVTSEHELFSWGAGGGGSLGTGDTENALQPRQVGFFKNRKVAQVACGWSHTVVLTKKGEIFTFGSGHHGQLGLNGTNMEIDPQKIRPLRGQKFTMVAAGSHHTIAATNKGRIYTWGQGKYGQTGFPGTADVLLPKRVEGLLLNEKEFTALAGGDRFSLAVGASGKVYLWGDNHHAEEDKTNAPEVLHSLTGKGVEQIAAGVFHTVVLTKSRAVYSWGWGHYGQLGHGDDKELNLPQFIEGLPPNIIQVACGFGHSYALSSDGEMYAWGWGEHGQLGAEPPLGKKGILKPRLVPVTADKKVLRIGSGWYHGFAVVSGACKGDCSGNGKCKRGVCECNKGFTGEDCSRVMHLNPLLRNAKMKPKVGEEDL